MLPMRTALLLSPFLGATFASVIPEARNIQARAGAVNGSCISAPDTACVSLVGLCVAKIAAGQIGSTAYWTDNVCVAAATCATMASVLDAACCAGTCRTPLQIGSLDVNTVYRSMVGTSCTSQTASSCTLKSQPFIDWFYGTIQTTGTNLWPDSGDDVLDRWQDIANWTGFCAGDGCVDGAIPYSNLNDWFHYSTAIIATTPGTPQYVDVFPTLEENIDNFTPNIFWPCQLDEQADCWWDYGPPPAGTFGSGVETLQVKAHPTPLVTAMQTKFTATVTGNSSSPFGRATFQPPNVPPPVYVNGELFPLVLNGSPVKWNVTTSLVAADDSLDFDAPSVITPDLQTTPNASGDLSELAIVPGACRGPIDIPTTLPTLTYFCPFFPGICQNIRSHPDWNAATNTMELTYDPFDGGKRRGAVCDKDVRAAMQASGICDPRQHDPNYWKISCDEFPFSSSLEGGSGNVVLLAVANAEQDLQGTLQSSITYLRRRRNNGKTSWGKASQCHRYQIKLVDTVPAGAPAKAIGSLDAGSQFFAKAGVTFKYVTNSNAAKPRPPTFPADTSYNPTQTAVVLPKTQGKTKVNCLVCPKPSPSPVPRDLRTEEEPSVLLDEPVSSPASLITAARELVKRQASSCTVPAGPALPTTSAGASAVAAASASSASAAAAAAIAALASASNASAAEAAAAAAAVSAANVLGPAAAALATAASDASLAAAIAASQAAITAAQSALNTIFSLGPDIPDWLTKIVQQVSSSTSAVSDAVDSSSNVVNPATPVPPDVDPSRDPVVNSGPPAGLPAAACFGAGSKGFLKIGDTYFVNENGKAPATLVDVGSDAFFGLTLPNNHALLPVDGCSGMYEWRVDGGLQPDFQVDCSTMELGSYWNGEKQACYAYREADVPDLFLVLCGNNIGNIYSCLQAANAFGTLNPAFISWATS